MNEQLWARIGDCGEYEDFGNDLDALLRHLNECKVGEITAWINSPVGIGFETPNFWGHDCIFCYWGDSDAGFLRELGADERAAIEAGLEKVLI